MYKWGVTVARWILQLVFGLEVDGLENIPSTGGAVVAANHTTWFDPIAVACALRRPVHFMAKAELFRRPLVAKVLRKVYAFPVRRGEADREAVRTAIRVVGEGHLLGIFPEGTRAQVGQLLPLQSGAVFIAAKSGVPIIPVAVSGVSPLRPRQKIVVRIGRPLDLAGPRRITKPEMEEASLAISKQFAQLLRRNID